MGVSIDVDLDLSGLTDDIAQIKSEIKSIEEDIDINIDDVEVVDKTGDGSGGGYNGSQDREFGGILRRLNSNIEEFNLEGFFSNRSGNGVLQNVLDDIDTSNSRSLPGPSGDMSIADRADASNKGLLGALDLDFLKNPRTKGVSDFSFPKNREIEDPDEAIKTFRKTRTESEKVSRGLDKMSESFKSVKRSAGRFKPTMGRLYNLLALALPVIVSAGVALVGLGAGLAGIAAAGGAVTVLGALGGKASTLEGSVAGAEQKVKDFKKELFQIFEPAADRFAPITDNAMAQIKSEARDLQDEVMAAAGAGRFFVSQIEPAGNLVERLVQTLMRFGPQLQAVFAGILGFLNQNAPGWLSGLIQTGLEAIPTLKRLGTLIGSLAKLLFSVSQIVTTFVASFAFLAPIIAAVANVLSSDLFKGFAKFAAIAATAIGILYGVGSALSVLSLAAGTSGGVIATLGGLFTWVGSTAIGSFLTGIYTTIAAIPGLIGSLLTLQGVLTAIAATIITITAGLALIGAASALGNYIMPDGSDLSGRGGGGGGFNPSGGGPGGKTTINVYGDVDNATQEDIRTKVGRANGEFGKMNGNFQ